MKDIFFLNEINQQKNLSYIENQIDLDNKKINYIYNNLSTDKTEQNIENIFGYSKDKK